MPDFIAGVIARQKKKKKKYLVMWTANVLKDGRISVHRKLKFPGGMEHPAEQGDLEKTLRAEIFEETGLQIRNNAVLTRYKSLDRHDHMKEFMGLWRHDCDGQLRTGAITDGRTWLGVPFFADKIFLDKYLHKDHRVVLSEID